MLLHNINVNKELYQGINFNYEEIFECNFTDCIFNDVIFNTDYCVGNNFTGSIFNGVIFDYVNLRECNFTGCIFNDVIFKPECKIAYIIGDGKIIKNYIDKENNIHIVYIPSFDYFAINSMEGSYNDFFDYDCLPEIEQELSSYNDFYNMDDNAIYYFLDNKEKIKKELGII